MRSFSVYGRVDVLLARRLASAASLFARELVETGSPSRPARVTVEVDEAIGHHPDQAFGTSGALLGRRFLFPDGHGHLCAVDPGTLSVERDLRTTVHLCCEGFSPKVLLEWVVLPLTHFPLAAGGWAPLHASGLVIRGCGGGVVISAWSGVGKTNMVLAGLREHDAGPYLGDDSVLVGRDGCALPSSRTVSAFGYNRRLIGSLPPGARARMALGDVVRRRASQGGARMGRVKGLLVYAANVYSNRRLEVERVRRENGFDPQPVALHLRAVADARVEAPRVSVRVEPMPPAVVAGASAGVLDYEFNQFRRLLETWRWATESAADPWVDLSSRWRDNLVAYFDHERVSANLHLPHPDGRVESLSRVWSELRDICRR